MLFADDTICISENARALSRLLQEIEKEGDKYGLKLNYDKCELISIHRGGDLAVGDKVYFRSGQEVKNKNEANQ